MQSFREQQSKDIIIVDSQGLDRFRANTYCYVHCSQCTDQVGKDRGKTGGSEVSSGPQPGWFYFMEIMQLGLRRKSHYNMPWEDHMLGEFL